MKEVIKNILCGLWHIKGFLLTFVGFIVYVVLLFAGSYKLAFASLIIAFINILLYLIYEEGKEIRGKISG